MVKPGWGILGEGLVAAHQQSVLEDEPDTARLQTFERWLRQDMGIDPAVEYPGIALSILFGLYRHEYAAAMMPKGMVFDTDHVLPATETELETRIGRIGTPVTD